MKAHTNITDTPRIEGKAAVRTNHDLAYIYPRRQKGNGKAQEQKPSDSVTVDDFHAHMPSHGYIFEPSREMWPASSVNSRIAPIPVSDADGKPVTDDKDKQKMISPAHGWIKTSLSSK